MRKCVIGFLGLLVAVAVLAVGKGWAWEKDSGKAKLDDKASLWMTKKLEFSQKILTGLTRGDFELIEKNAGEMYVVGYLEKWDRAHLPEYRKQVKVFDAATKDLIRHAKEKNIDGATKAYAQLVVNCVECHKVVRDTKKK